MQQVIFRLLGPPEISYNDQPIRIPRRRSRALLYYMVSTHTPQPRERLMTLLCGEMDEESARRAFKTMLAEVRSQLRNIDPSIEWIISDEDRLTFNPLAPIWLDTEIFEKDTANLMRNLNQAVRLYRGAFLDGFFLKGAPDFDSWVQSTRDHFHHLYMMALQHMADVYESNQQLEEAITCVHMLLVADPLSEDAHAHLMRLYWQAGDRTQALRQYERLGKMLAEEFSVQPLAKTQALYQQIASSAETQHTTLSAPSPVPVGMVFTSGTSPVSELPLLAVADVPAPDVILPWVGRSRELDWLRDHLLGDENECPLLLLRGEVGMGKTRLLQEMTRRYCANWLVLHGTCQEGESENWYHPLIDALRSGLAREDIAHLELHPSWRGQLERLVPDLFRSTSTGPSVAMGSDAGMGYGDITLLADALVALLNQLVTVRRPLLLLLDDLHWCDKGTLGLLSHLARYVRRQEVFLLGAYSPCCDRKQLETLRNTVARVGALAEIELEPLSLEDTGELVALFSAQHTSHTVSRQTSAGLSLSDWCYQHSEGNPLYTLAWLEAGQQRPTTFVPERIASLLDKELRRLSQHARTLLQLAACYQEEFDLARAGSQLGSPLVATLAASAELIEQRWIHALPATTPSVYALYTFSHATARAYVLNTMTEIERYMLRQAVRGPYSR